MNDKDFQPPADRVWWRCSLTEEARAVRGDALAKGMAVHIPQAPVLLAYSQLAYRAWMAGRVWFRCELGELDCVMLGPKINKAGDFKGNVRVVRGQVTGVMCVWPEEIREGRRLTRQQRGDIWEAAQRGDTIKSIADHFGITERRVRALAKGKRRR